MIQLLFRFIILLVRIIFGGGGVPVSELASSYSAFSASVRFLPAFGPSVCSASSEEQARPKEHGWLYPAPPSSPSASCPRLRLSSGLHHSPPRRCYYLRPVVEKPGVPSHYSQPHSSRHPPSLPQTQCCPPPSRPPFPPISLPWR